VTERIADYDFHLPEELIAQQPPAQRDAARMLLLNRSTGALADSHFTSLPALLNSGDLLVLNDSRVIPARLYATRAGLASQKQSPTGRVEVMLAQQLGPFEWNALVHPGRKVLVGERLFFAAPDAAPATPPLLTAEVIARSTFGERTLRFAPCEKNGDDFFTALDRIGHMPLPPYIHRDDAPADRERYQTVFADARGSAAAPTAGLHFTPAVLEAIRNRGVEVAHVTLHVGLGTFLPVRVDTLDEIKLHTERYTLPATTAEAVNRARAEGRRIIAAGTTTVRTLEHCALAGRELAPHSGETSIFIRPGHKFRVVNALLTNFHLPQSTLLMLVSAFAGREHALAAYHHAVREHYRFFSYGDCMFIS
jgi:S-adenosylmethionine:tRNA ribosyltransferase-isomerase